jgi:hypothetical protein
MQDEYLDTETGKVYKRTVNALPIPENSTKTDGILTVSVVDGLYTVHLTGDTAAHLVTFPVKKFFIPKSLDSGGSGTFDLRNGSMNNIHMRFYYEGALLSYIGLSAQNRVVTNYNFGNQFCDAIGIYAVPNSSSTNRTLRPQILTDGSTTSPASYIPYLNQQDPPVPFPTLALSAGDNEVSFDTTVLPSQLDIKYYSWNIIQPKQYRHGTWYLPGVIEYGWHINSNESNPNDCITYLKDAIGKNPASMDSTTFNYGDWENAFFMPKPCMVKSNGTVDYYLDPNDYTKKADGTASDINDLTYDGNAMMEWPLIWWKYEADPDDQYGGNFYVSNTQIDSSYECWCNYDCDNNITEHFYTAIYNGIIYDYKMRSLSGFKLNDYATTTYSTTQTTYDDTATYAVNDIVRYQGYAYKCITAVETPETFDPNKWTQVNVYDVGARVSTSNIMYECITAVTQVEAFDSNKWVQVQYCGNTTGTQETTSATANNTTTGKTEWYIDTWSDRMLINGLLILISKSLNTQAKFGNGIISGSQTAKTNYTTGSLDNKGLFYGSVSGTSTAVKVFGMENWWGLIYHRTAGLVGTSTGYAYKLTYNNKDGSTATSYNSNGSGYLAVTQTRPASNYLNKAVYGNYGYLPAVTSSSGSTVYYCDYYYNGTGFLLVGGSSFYGASAGASYFNLGNSFAYRSRNIGACLTLKPLGSP